MSGIQVFCAALASAVTPGPSAPPAAAQFPSCPRPNDFSIGKSVGAYEACLDRQQKFCDQNEKIPVCKKFLSPKNEVLRTGPGSDVASACSIQKDGSYKCEQERVRFLVPQEVIQPLASPGNLNIDEDGTVSPLATATGNPATGAGTGAGAGAGGNTQPPPFIPPPPPPGFNPNK